MKNDLVNECKAEKIFVRVVIDINASPKFLLQLPELAKIVRSGTFFHIICIRMALNLLNELFLNMHSICLNWKSLYNIQNNLQNEF